MLFGIRNFKDAQKKFKVLEAFKYMQTLSLKGFHKTFKKHTK